jgi:hypothetical protein
MQVPLRPTTLNCRSLVAGGVLQDEKAEGALSIWFEVQLELYGD